MFGQLILFECWTRVVQCDAPARSPGCSLTYHKGRWRYGEVMPLYVYWFQWQRLRFFMGCGCIISVARVWCDEVLRLLMLLGQKRWPVLGASGLAARTCQLSDLTSSVDWNIMQLPELNSRLQRRFASSTAGFDKKQVSFRFWHFVFTEGVPVKLWSAGRIHL